MNDCHIDFNVFVLLKVEHIFEKEAKIMLRPTLERSLYLGDTNMADKLLESFSL